MKFNRDDIDVTFDPIVSLFRPGDLQNVTNKHINENQQQHVCMFFQVYMQEYISS